MLSRKANLPSGAKMTAEPRQIRLPGFTAILPTYGA
jgi:hypothetical protein